MCILYIWSRARDASCLFCLNMFLICSICYDLYDDVSTSEFKYMICESNFPFNSTLIKSQCHIQKKILKGLLKGVKRINIPFVYKLIYGI